MAARFWVGGTGNWDASTTTNWSDTSGGAGGFSVPTSADTVTFDSLSNATAYTVTVTAIANCSDITLGNPLVGALTFAGSLALNVYGNFTIVSTITRTYTGAITFAATSTGKTMTFNGITMASAMKFNGIGAGWTLQDNINNSTSNIQLNAGTLDTNSKTITCGGFFPTSTSGTAVLTLGSSTINTTRLNTFLDSSLTLNAGTSTINATNGPALPLGIGSKSFNIINYSGISTNCSITGSGTIATLTITGEASILPELSLSSNIIVTGTLTINGNSSINRILIKSDTIGTARTLTAATIVVTNADFKDITGAGAGSWNISAVTGGSGDCGGNSGITFTTPVTQHWLNASSGNWSLNTNWTSRVPLPQDDVVMDKAFGTSQTVTMDMPRLGNSIDFTGATWTTSLTLATSIVASYTLFGSLTLISGLTTSAGNPMIFASRVACNLNPNGASFNFPLYFQNFGSTLTLQNNLTLIGGSLFLYYGNFNANNFNVSAGLVSRSGASAGTITMGSGTWSISGSTFDLSTKTIVANTSTVKFTDTSAAGCTFTGGSKTYNNIWFARGTSTGSNTISGSNTFADFKDTGTVAHSILFTAGTTQTVSTFTVSGTVGNVITLNSTTTATATLTAPSRSNASPVSCDYLNIQHSIATQLNTWYAGVNSVDNQAVATAGSGWIFTAPVAVTSNTGAGFFLM